MWHKTNAKKTILCATCTARKHWRYCHIQPFCLTMVRRVTRIHINRILSLGMFKILGIHVKIAKCVWHEKYYQIWDSALLERSLLLLIVGRSLLHAICHRLWTEMFENFVIGEKLFAFVACAGTFLWFSLLSFYVTISTVQISFFFHSWCFTVKTILRWKILCDVIWNFRNFVIITIILRARLLFFTLSSNPCHKISTSQMSSHFLARYANSKFVGLYIGKVIKLYF